MGNFFNAIFSKIFGKKTLSDEQKSILFKKYKSIIDSTKIPYIKITASPDQNLEFWQSKFGGLPYLPKGARYPFNKQGEFLQFLAQINFEEIPKLEPFPDKGILQFYIADNDDYGLDFSRQENQDSFRVLYFPEVNQSEAQSDFSFLPNVEHSPLQAKVPSYILQFTKETMPVCISDYRFSKLIGTIEESIAEDIYDYCSDNEQHQIGGYAHFTQTDPRSYQAEHADKEYILLQIDTDDKNEIMWGDCGVGNFFISGKDLKNKDFSKVLYNWDCC